MKAAHDVGGERVIHLPRIHDLLDTVLDADPAREALVGRHARYSYADLDAAADRAARWLVELGVRPGDRVAAALPSSTDIAVAFHGAMRASAVWVGISQKLTAPEMLHILADSGSAVLLCDTESATRIDAEGPRPSDLRRVVVLEDPQAGWADVTSRTAGAGPRMRRKLGPSEPAGLAYTSGTSGFPKGVVHTEHNLLAVGRALVESRGWGPDLRKGDCLSLTILNLIVLNPLLCAQAGGCAIVMDRTDPEGLADWFERERITVWNGVPAMLHSLMRSDVDPASLATLAEVWTGGGDCPDDLRHAFRERFGIPVTTTYGLTEAPAVVSIAPPGIQAADGSSGVPLPHLSVSIRDDAGQVLPPATTGEICVEPASTGPFAGISTTMLGYWENPSATATALRDGHLRTGDTGQLSADGELRVLGRTTTVIIRGGANVYPAEVERVLMAHPDVRGCTVIGRPDERLGEIVAAIVEADAQAVTVEELQEFCARSLAKYKVPQQVVIVADLPRNAMGKVIVHKARDLLGSDGEPDA